MSPRKKQEDAPTEDMPAILGLSGKTRAVAYFLREVGLPYACVLGIFGFLAAVFYYVLLPQNQQSIDNQKALQATAAKLTDVNSSWALIVDKAIETEMRFRPAIEANTAEIRALREEILKMKRN